MTAVEDRKADLMVRAMVIGVGTAAMVCYSGRERVGPAPNITWASRNL